MDTVQSNSARDNLDHVKPILDLCPREQEARLNDVVSALSGMCILPNPSTVTDSEQHQHVAEQWKSVLNRIARKLGLPDAYPVQESVAWESQSLEPQDAMNLAYKLNLERGHARDKKAHQ